MSLIVARTASAAGTRALAAEVAPIAAAGDIVVLAGDLGAGKTVWVQGFADGLGVRDAVTSPTFTLVHPYQGDRLRLLHADLYRLDLLSEVIDLGLTEQLDDDAVACIEWGDLAEAALPPDFLEVHLAADTNGTNGTNDTNDSSDDERTLTFRLVGPRWAARQDALNRALAPWLDQRDRQ